MKNTAKTTAGAPGGWKTCPLTADDVRAAGQEFNPTAELVKWRRWATSLTGGDGFQGDEEQRSAVECLVSAVSKEDMATAIGTLERLARVLLTGRETWAPDELVSAASTLFDQANDSRQEAEELRGQVAPLDAQKRICALQIQIDEMREAAATRPALTADAVRAVVREAVILESDARRLGAQPSFIDGIAARVAEKLAGRTMGGFL